MQSTARWIPIAIWLLAGVAAAWVCSLTFSAAHVGAEYVPVGNDSFYHARRILDTANDPAGFYEFDSKIHVPEGSLLVWPWGYDYGMAMLVRVGLMLGVSDNPMAILTWIPVAAVFVSIGLLILIALRLSLTPWPTAVAALCMALAPTTQLLHGAGKIDHHFAEMILLLATLAAGLSWLQLPLSNARAAMLGALLGIAPAIHNATFILQLPVLITAFAMWLQHQRLPIKSTLAFAIALVIGTVAVLIPSTPFLDGRFEFYTLSWFHLYVAGCAAAAMLLMSYVSFTRKGLALVLGACALLSLPLLHEVTTASTFVGGAHKYLENIDEVRSPATLAMKLGYMPVARAYSLLIFLAPATFILCLVQCWRERASPRLLFWITSVLGLALLSAQQRMHYFGGFALYLPWLVVAADLADRTPEMRKKILLGATIVALLCYAPVLRYQLIERMPLSNDPYFAGVRPLYMSLKEACARDPGVVLADSNAGHPIRFYTDCSVIANNFILTPQHFEKLAEADRLFSLSAAELASQTQIKYLLIRTMAMRERPDGSVQYKLFFSNTSRLANELLFVPASQLPPNYTLLQEMSFMGKATYSRLLRIEHPTAAASE